MDDVIRAMRTQAAHQVSKMSEFMSDYSDYSDVLAQLVAVQAKEVARQFIDVSTIAEGIPRLCDFFDANLLLFRSPLDL
jgi:hypothetical protein